MGHFFWQAIAAQRCSSAGVDLFLLEAAPVISTVSPATDRLNCLNSLISIPLIKTIWARKDR